MYSFPVAVAETGNGRPDVPDADCQQNATCLDYCFIAQLDREELTRLIIGRVDDAGQELDAIFCAFLASARAQLRRSYALVAKESVDTARFPVAWIAGIDDDDFVEVSRQPERGGKSAIRHQLLRHHIAVRACGARVQFRFPTAIAPHACQMTVTQNFTELRADHPAIDLRVRPRPSTCPAWIPAGSSNFPVANSWWR